MDSNTTNLCKDIFIIPAKGMHKKTPGRGKMLTLAGSNFEKKKEFQNNNSWSILEVANFHETLMNY